MSGSLQGTKLNGRYLLADRIGEGGMAEVYRAEDTLLERTVAVKVLRPQFSSDPDFLARFQQEARFAAKFSHPNIVSVYDVGADGSTHYIVMEYVDGRSLKAEIEAGAPFIEGVAVGVASQILSALSFAHQKGLVHRDIKPQNVLIGPEGQVKVADFGIARASAGSQATRGMVLATVQYAAPEQLSGQQATESSDLYSVGVVIFEMLTGRVPFDGDSSVAVALKHVQSPPPPIRRLNPSVSPGLEAVVLRALAKAPGDRFASATEMRRALRSYRGADQSTSTFQPESLVAGAATAVLSPVNVAPKKGGVDWAAIVLGILAFVLVAGAVPLGLRLYNQYYGQQQVVATKTPAVVVEVLPTATGTPTATPTPTQTPAPSATVPPSPVPVQVPRLVEMQFSQAQRQVEALGLKLRKAGEDFSPVYAEGVIINQSPTPDKTVPTGGTIDVIVSKGQEKLAVPAVVGLPQADATSALADAGFRVKVAPKANEQVPAGIVLSQQPGALEMGVKGSEVTITVSSGPAPTATPTATPRPTATPTKAPTATSTPRPTATRIPTPTVSQSGIPASGTTVQYSLAANETAMLVGPQLTYPAFICPNTPTQACVLILTVSKATNMSVTGVTPGANSLDVWDGITADQAIAQQSASFWQAPNCANGCAYGTVGIFLDGNLVEIRTIAK